MPTDTSAPVTAEASVTEEVAVDISINLKPRKFVLQTKKGKTKKDAAGKEVTAADVSYLWPEVKSIVEAGDFLKDLVFEAERLKAGNGILMFDKLVGRRVLDANKTAIDKDGNIDTNKIVPDLCNPGHKAGLNVSDITKQREVLIEEADALAPLQDLPANSPATLEALQKAGFKTRDDFIRASSAIMSKIREMNKLIREHNAKLALAAEKRAKTLAEKAKAATPKGEAPTPDAGPAPAAAK